jgi:hypothetical protein
MIEDQGKGKGQGVPVPSCVGLLIEWMHSCSRHPTDCAEKFEDVGVQVRRYVQVGEVVSRLASKRLMRRSRGMAGCGGWGGLMRRPGDGMAAC